MDQKPHTCAYGNRAWAKLNVGFWYTHIVGTNKITELTTKGKTRSRKKYPTHIYSLHYTHDSTIQRHDVSCVFGKLNRAYICCNSVFIVYLWIYCASVVHFGFVGNACQMLSYCFRRGNVDGVKGNEFKGEREVT